MKLECQNCGKIGDESEFNEAKRLSERHTIGDVYSDMECPDCESLAFPWLSDAEKKLNAEPYKAGNDALNMLRQIYALEPDDEGDVILFKEFMWRPRIKKILDMDKEDE